jgi:hypothetical protein
MRLAGYIFNFTPLPSLSKEHTGPNSMSSVSHETIPCLVKSLEPRGISCEEVYASYVACRKKQPGFLKEIK